MTDIPRNYKIRDEDLTAPILGDDIRQQMQKHIADGGKPDDLMLYTL